MMMRWALAGPLRGFARPQVRATELLRPCLCGAVRGFGDKAGVVMWFNPDRGFGFITSEGVEYFVHYSGIDSAAFRTLGDGEEVEFNVEEDVSGRMRAVCVTGPDGAPVQGSRRQRE
eukprot:NODE_19598_length_836_cov_2.940762.p2 GENE.NODE_19598_length_836_cov_2.940762~~NODE_19598_length_836_cov_2.940762.p2  ORF type:complete len:117 (-),score=28.70 NODE_19598_length_836_cov_2.940762:395-745(-)